ncbi:MAG: glutamate 5-kinase [Candidatus Omnitrophota bacterium]|nr:glutamate 5-kinase [Candidatus Omnitrophota bacterium]
MGKGKKSKIAVIKIGTSVITTKSGNLDRNRIKHVAEQVSRIKKKGFNAVIVSSGAIGAGIGLLNLSSRPEYLPELQACAAIGQVQLMKVYDEHFRKFGYLTAQVLLTQDDVNNRSRYLNARNTIMALIKKNVIPVINENDTISTEEIKFGDNDRLSSLVSILIEADILIMMSDVDGLYRFDLKDKTKKELIKRVEHFSDALEDLVLKECGRFSVGGMRTKLQAVRMAVNAGIECVFVNGRKKNILADIFNGKEAGTVFVSTQPKISARKRWIAYSSKTKGAVKVDAGARDALIKKNRSLLASGVIGYSGQFSVGDSVYIVDESDKEFARGIVNYSSAELIKIKGLKTKDIENALGYKYYDEVIHRDNLVIL